MAANTNVLINIGARVENALRGFGKVNEALEEQDNATSKWRKSVSKSAALAGAAIAAGATAAAAGLAFAAKEMIDMGREAVANEQNAALLADTLKNIGFSDKQIEKNERWITSMRIGSLVIKDELRQSVADLTLATGDLGKAQELSALAWDAAVASGKGYEEISEALVEATKGETGALIEQFQWLETSEDGTLSYRDAIKQLEKAYKGSAKAAADRDPWERLKAIWDELRIALGNWLIPVMERLGEWFKDPKNQKKVQDFIDKMSRLSYEVGTKVADAIEDFYNWLKSPEGQKAIRDVKDLVEDLTDALIDLNDWLVENRTAFRLLGLGIAIESNKIKFFTWAVEKAVGWLKTLWAWIKTVGGSSLLKLATGGLIPGFRAAAAPQITQPAANAAARYITAPLPRQGGTSGASNVTVNLQTNDPFRAGAQIKRMVEGNDVVQGRPRGRPLALAW